MTHPLSRDLPMSAELESVFDCASELATNEGRPVLSAHLLLALYSVHNHAATFLQEHELASLPAQVRQHAPQAHEHGACVSRIFERSRRLAKGAGAHDVTTMHLLASILRESNSAAYRMLEAGGLNVSGIRTRVMSYATGSHTSLRPTLTRRGPLDAPGLDQVSSTPIEIHPSLRQATLGVELDAPTKKMRSQRRRQSRQLLQERSSPVHPALRPSLLRSTPQPAPTPTIEPSPAVLEPKELAPTPRPKTLKERFAELKKEARKRRSALPQAPETSYGIEPDKFPPSVRRATEARRRTHEPITPLNEPNPPIDTTRKEDTHLEALDDARHATRNLAARLFGKKEAKREEEPNQTPLEHDSIDAGASEAIAEIESVDIHPPEVEPLQRETLAAPTLRSPQSIASIQKISPCSPSLAEISQKRRPSPVSTGWWDETRRSRSSSTSSANAEATTPS